MKTTLFTHTTKIDGHDKIHILQYLLF